MTNPDFQMASMDQQMMWQPIQDAASDPIQWQLSTPMCYHLWFAEIRTDYIWAQYTRR